MREEGVAEVMRGHRLRLPRLDWTPMLKPRCRLRQTILGTNVGPRRQVLPLRWRWLPDFNLDELLSIYSASWSVGSAL